MTSRIRNILRPVKYPEFTVPGSLCLMIGCGLAVMAWILGNATGTPLLAALLIVTGIALLFRNVLGTVLMAVALAFGIYNAIGRMEFSWSAAPRILASTVFWASMISSLVTQIQFHRHRNRKVRLSSPPTAKV